MLVRLEDADQPLGRILLPQGAKRRANFGGMMAVIIDDDRAVASADFGHSPIDAGEIAKRFGRPRRIDAARGARGDRHRRIEQIMFAGDATAAVCPPACP